ncbi:MAG: DUF2461 domain-containing protein [Alphaproteobacteria bacterium]|nr:DUF2461 domain-containing protein [Alphaproteobacteria bacterium]HPF47122.1 DUF2461 domain-containing protein [Emcibacteraceae bacterium]
MTNFKGFQEPFWQFFDELKENNNREWFMENKDRYKADIVTPCLDFIIDMGERLKEISPHYTAIAKASGGSMFRIYRDARFSNDKRPYKENAGIQFRHKLGKDAHAPGYYLHLEKDNIFYGGGIWMPDNTTLGEIRDRICYYPKKWQAVIENEDLIGTFGGVRDDGLTRPPRGYDADHKYIEDLKRKSFFAMKNGGDYKITTNAKFLDEVAKTFDAAAPLMAFICDAKGIEF